MYNIKIFMFALKPLWFLIHIILCLPSYGQADIRVIPEIEQHRSQAEEQAQKSLIQEAVDAIEQTKRAAAAITKGESKEALAAIEQANGKLSILIARHPEEALLPVDYRVKIIDSAPTKIKDIRKTSIDAIREVEKRYYPAARLLLDILRSEINIRTYHLPLSTFPLALQEAAHLIEQKKLNQAYTVLRMALNTLVIINRVLPLPLLNVGIFMAEAEEEREKNKGSALYLVGKARYELERAKELGYAEKNETYSSMHKAIDDLEKDLRANKNTASSFAALKNKVKGFVEHFSNTQTQSRQPEKKHRVNKAST